MILKDEGQLVQSVAFPYSSVELKSVSGEVTLKNTWSRKQETASWLVSDSLPVVCVYPTQENKAEIVAGGSEWVESNSPNWNGPRPLG